MLGAQGIRATGFKRAQGNAHCAKFESHTNRVTFETNAIRMTSSVQAQGQSLEPDHTMLDLGKCVLFVKILHRYTYYKAKKELVIKHNSTGRFTI